MNNKDVQNFYEELHTPRHIRAHCAQVTRIADFIGKKISEKGIEVDLGKLRAAALLHDAVRVVDFRQWPPESFAATVEDMTVWNELRDTYHGQDHAKAMGDILRKRGYADLAQIIEEHNFTQILKEEGFSSIESEILYYADKRVRHDEIVSLKKRLEEGARRYGKEPNPEAEKKLFALEEKLCAQTGITPETIT